MAGDRWAARLGDRKADLLGAVAAGKKVLNRKETGALEGLLHTQQLPVCCIMIDATALQAGRG